MTFRSMPTSLMVVTTDVATILLGTLYLAGRRLQAGYQLRQLSDLQLRDIGLNRSEVTPHTPFLHREVMRHELGRR
ncbi:MAG TPA: DUF1127 domain-containing protein [Aestuariivirgaceae bacterium]|jgi:hypothetical protein|nr:DUF1127 domain-containing protein [Aestuariivirgaceae bacterium]